MIREVLVSPTIDAELRTPVPVPDREVRPISDGGLQDIGLLLTDYDEALGDANGKIVAIDETLTDFERRALENRCETEPEFEGCAALES